MLAIRPLTNHKSENSKKPPKGVTLKVTRYLYLAGWDASLPLKEPNCIQSFVGRTLVIRTSKTIKKAGQPMQSTEIWMSLSVLSASFSRVESKDRKCLEYTPSVAAEHWMSDYFGLMKCPQCPLPGWQGDELCITYMELGQLSCVRAES